MGRWPVRGPRSLKGAYRKLRVASPHTDTHSRNKRVRVCNFQSCICLGDQQVPSTSAFRLAPGGACIFNFQSGFFSASMSKSGRFCGLWRSGASEVLRRGGVTHLRFNAGPCLTGMQHHATAFLISGNEPGPPVCKLCRALRQRGQMGQLACQGCRNSRVVCLLKYSGSESPFEYCPKAHEACTTCSRSRTSCGMARQRCPTADKSLSEEVLMCARRFLECPGSRQSSSQHCQVQVVFVNKIPACLPFPSILQEHCVCYSVCMSINVSPVGTPENSTRIGTFIFRLWDRADKAVMLQFVLQTASGTGAV